MSDPNLPDVQHWFKTVLVGHGHLPEKMARAEALWNLRGEELIKGDERVSKETRIGIYTTGYMLRLLECMQADLPSLYAFWGESLFDLFGRAYLLQHPSQSHSLFELTAGYAGFLDQTRPPDEAIEEGSAIEYDIPAELVRMERARLAAILSKGTEGETIVPDLGFFSFFSGEKTLLEVHPAVQLLVQKMPLIDLYRQLMLGEEPSIPDYQTTYVAATRMQFKIQFFELTDWQYELLHYLQANDAPTDLHEAIHQVASQTQRDKADLLSEVCLWLPNAVEMGLVK
ncbi:MAG: putative DNA-binding domain-containing protein [Bacteroidota bacterium]